MMFVLFTDHQYIQKLLFTVKQWYLRLVNSSQWSFWTLSSEYRPLHGKKKCGQNAVSIINLKNHSLSWEVLLSFYHLQNYLFLSSAYLSVFSSICLLRSVHRINFHSTCFQVWKIVISLHILCILTYFFACYRCSSTYVLGDLKLKILMKIYYNSSCKQCCKAVIRVIFWVTAWCSGKFHFLSLCYCMELLLGNLWYLTIFIPECNSISAFKVKLLFSLHPSAVYN